MRIWYLIGDAALPAHDHADFDLMPDMRRVRSTLGSEQARPVRAHRRLLLRIRTLPAMGGLRGWKTGCRIRVDNARESLAARPSGFGGDVFSRTKPNGH